MPPGPAPARGRVPEEPAQRHTASLRCGQRRPPGDPGGLRSQSPCGQGATPPRSAATVTGTVAACRIKCPSTVWTGTASRSLASAPRLELELLRLPHGDSVDAAEVGEGRPGLDVVLALDLVLLRTAHTPHVPPAPAVNPGRTPNVVPHRLTTSHPAQPSPLPDPPPSTAASTTRPHHPSDPGPISGGPHLEIPPPFGRGPDPWWALPRTELATLGRVPSAEAERPGQGRPGQGRPGHG